MWGEMFPSGEPFSTPTIVFLDTIRIIMVLGSIGIAAFALPIARHVRNSRQYGCFALAAYSMFAAVFEFARIGQPTVSPALFLVMIGTALGYTYCFRVSKEIRRGEYLEGGRHYTG